MQRYISGEQPLRYSIYHNTLCYNAFMYNPEYTRAFYNACREAEWERQMELWVDNVKFERIAVDPKMCTGKPCIKHARFPVSRILGMLASGETRESILASYPYLDPEDIDESLRYAASVVVVDKKKPGSGIFL
ncbi:MAG: DUF433 domain-containing protein [Dehalococcoidales bacterium]|nr:DUF433 domain-containing protein [Dehalococcoidales bacterium]